METKSCVRCKETKEVSEFNWKNEGAGEKNKYCRDCSRAASRRWYKKHASSVVRKNNDRTRNLVRWFKELKSTLSCSSCDESDPCCLDFHHVDPNSKDVCVGNIIKMGWSRDRIVEEISKCVVLCSNCHRKIHRDIAEADVRS